MHPKDAEKRGLKRNDVVKVSTRRGEISLRVDTKGRNKYSVTMVATNDNYAGVARFTR
jgi:nitrate reductase NapA